MRWSCKCRAEDIGGVNWAHGCEKGQQARGEYGGLGEDDESGGDVHYLGVHVCNIPLKLDNRYLHTVHHPPGSYQYLRIHHVGAIGLQY